MLINGADVGGKMRDIALGIGAAGMLGCMAFLVAILVSLIKHKPAKPKIAALCVSFAVMVAGSVIAGPAPKDEATTESVTERMIVTETEEAVSETEEPETTQNTTAEKRTTTETVTESTEAEKFVVDINTVPKYSSLPYTELNGNIPMFSDEEKTKTDVFEYYSALDHLGRCGVAYANVCKDIMPTEERGEIGRVKPTGWVQNKYPGIVDSEPPYLYNRCHLIAYSLAGENDNELNLVTGTRYMNVEGMNPFELQVLDYVRSTDNHVLYRVTPIFEGDNLLASGVEMEAWSLEDKGKGICFHVYCYNVQPGIVIDYATGENRLSNEVLENSEDTTSDAVTTELTTEMVERNTTESTEEAKEYKYILNTNSMKIHRPTCSSVNDMAEHNKLGANDDIEELKKMGYSPCQKCLKGY